jgi:septum formation protein
MFDLGNYKLVLGSASPRRQELMRQAGFEFELKTIDADESFEAQWLPKDVPQMLAQRKASLLLPELKDHQVLITADTIVATATQILNKPANATAAFAMLSSLSNHTHTVYTGVCIAHCSKVFSFVDATQVSFAALTDEEISYYIKHYTPYDKAGAYGAQDWIGLVGIEKIVGSYFNVMGLPMHLIYKNLKSFIQQLP